MDLQPTGEYGCVETPEASVKAAEDLRSATLELLRASDLYYRVYCLRDGKVLFAPSGSVITTLGSRGLYTDDKGKRHEVEVQDVIPKKK